MNAEQTIGDILITGDAEGTFTLDAVMLAARFGWSVEQFRAQMRRGLVTSVVERGEGDDCGRWRLSVRCGNRRWQAIVEADGTTSDHRLDFVTIHRDGEERGPSGDRIGTARTG